MAAQPPGQELLEPSLLDRLLDDQRVIGEIVVVLEPQHLAEHGTVPEVVFRALERRGWNRVSEDAEPLRATFQVPRSEANPARCRGADVRLASEHLVTLEQLGQVEVRLVANLRAEGSEQPRLSARRLRDAIARDLGWLLNTLSLDATQDLGNFPHVRRAVVNFGMPSLAGRTLASIDPEIVARQIETAISNFEPRLSKVRVTAGQVNNSAIENEIKFEIEAEMWSYPASQRVVLDTRIDIDSGDVHVKDGG